jgi:carbamoyltransferase
MKDRALLSSRLAREFERILQGRQARREWAAKMGNPHFIGHHLAHAFSLIPWGLPDNSLVLVSDTVGERDSVGFYHWNGAGMRLLVSSPWPHSPGAVLQQAADHLGFEGERGPGKLMALAAWGKSRSNLLPPGLSRVNDGRFVLDLREYPAFMVNGAWARASHRWIEPGNTARNQALGEFVAKARGAEAEGADFAATVQDWFETTLLDLAAAGIARAKTLSLPVVAIGLAGGSALNCQANGKLARALPGFGLKSMVVSPWSNDAGTAIGAAAALAVQSSVAGLRCRGPMLGPTGKSVHRDGRSIESAIENATSALLAGKVIGLVSGGVEFGPRALGGRCLLADARLASSKTQLNDMKGRPQFMPLAPAVLGRDANPWFEGAVSSNMAWTVPYSPEAEAAFPGMRHPSGETRAQAVTAVTAPLLHQLLEATSAAGMPILLLTSLNGPGEPMLANQDESLQAASRLGAGGCLTDAGWVERD